MRLPLKVVRDWEPFGITFIGDPHLESPAHNRELFEHDMNAAAQRGDMIIMMGDINDWILPGDRKRMSARHRIEAEGAINRVVGSTVKRLQRWADNIDLMLMGNHETAVMKHHSMDPISMVVYHLNQIKKDGVFPDKKCHSGGYQCWLQLQFVRKSNGKRAGSQSQMIWLHHGSGSGAAVTKGMIDGNRAKVSNVFDVGVIGHKHTHIHDTDRYTYLDDMGSVKRKYRDFFVVGGYNGAEVVQDPDFIDEDSIYPRGMDLDYSETFYNNQGQGSVRVEFIPRMREGHNWIKRRVTTESQSLAP